MTVNIREGISSLLKEHRALFLYHVDFENASQNLLKSTNDLNISLNDMLSKPRNDIYIICIYINTVVYLCRYVIIIIQ